MPVKSFRVEAKQSSTRQKEDALFRFVKQCASTLPLPCFTNLSRYRTSNRGLVWSGLWTKLLRTLSNCMNIVQFDSLSMSQYWCIGQEWIKTVNPDHWPDHIDQASYKRRSSESSWRRTWTCVRKEGQKEANVLGDDMATGGGMLDEVKWIVESYATDAFAVTV